MYIELIGLGEVAPCDWRLRQRRPYAWAGRQQTCAEPLANATQAGSALSQSNNSGWN